MKRLKVVCKDDETKDGYKINITKGKSYDVIESYTHTPSDCCFRLSAAHPSYHCPNLREGYYADFPTNKENFVVYCIINDKNVRASYKQSWFKSISDIREEKLNELGIK